MNEPDEVSLYVKPVTKTIKLNVVQPTDVYKTLKKQTKMEYSYLLESGEGDTRSARYSFIGVNPIGRLEINNSKPTLIGKTYANIDRQSKDPLKILETSFGKTKVLPTKNTPRFIGGAVGYLTYDIVRSYLPNLEEKRTTLNTPDAEFLYTKDVIVFDHLTQELCFVCCALGEDEQEIKDDIPSAENQIADLEEIVLTAEKSIVDFSQTKKNPEHTTDTTRDEFISMVKKSKNHIREGDIFQVVISKKAMTDAKDPYETYLALKTVNPSPYLYFLEFGDTAVIGSSPEMLVRVNNNRVITRPIAGTRKRGTTELQDQTLAQNMLNDPKELAEHIMLVDLHRNDLGRVCSYGSVDVTQLMEVVRYSHVQHIVTTVEGNLDKKCSSFDALRSLFPAGTVSGAPKVRAMEIINDLEIQRRGAYAGAVGYFSLDGNLDFAITIRTIVQNLSKAYVQAGSGIVSDSVPEKEWIESENKAAAMMQAISMVI